MSIAEPAAEVGPYKREGIGSRFMRVLTIPAVDKTIAIVASLPFVYSLYHRLYMGMLDIPRACAAIGLLIVIATMVLRRAPQRITPNPLWWLLAFVATYGALFWTTFAPPGRPIVPGVVTNAISLGSFVIVVYARMSLGRNIGFVPAQRNIVRSGAYRYVRHPIYTGLFFAWASFTLHLYSPANIGILLTVYTLFVIKSIVEEDLLRQDPEYARYMDEVKYRFIPGLV
jgi:protein-S-isoprenylcysteine O-methyltransferase Ste14